MVWVYGDPPFSTQEKDIYLKLNRKLKNREFAEKIVKLLSLFNYIRRQKYSDWKDLQNSVFFDDAKTQPVFDDKTAKTVFKLMQQKGGSQYPMVNSAINKMFSTLGSILPSIITTPVSFVYNGVTGAFETVVNFVPFADLALEAGKTGAAVTNVAIENLAGAIGGAPGEVLAFLITFTIASAAASIHLLERDFGGAIEQIFRAIPVIGTILQTMLQKGEGIASKVDKDIEKIKGHFESVKNAISKGIDAVKGDTSSINDKLVSLRQNSPAAQQLYKDTPASLREIFFPESAYGPSAPQFSATGDVAAPTTQPAPVSKSSRSWPSLPSLFRRKPSVPQFSATGDVAPSTTQPAPPRRTLRNRISSFFRRNPSVTQPPTGDTATPRRTLRNRISSLFRRKPSAQPPTAGKRFSTMRNRHTKWMTTRRRRFATR